MINPFKRFLTKKEEKPEAPSKETESKETAAEEPVEDEAAEPEPQEPADSFIEWSRTQVRGGIERRERNDIFEAYSVFGTDGDKLICRYYHRYPEHEREFDLSYSRELTFDELNRRLLSELDKSDLKLSDYNVCIQEAEALALISDNGDTNISCGLSEQETSALHDFCEAMDTLKEKSYLNSNGEYRCDSESVVGGEYINIRFRKPMKYDALYKDVSGVRKEEVGGYDIGNFWIMGVYNRLRDLCASCKVIRLTSEWSLDGESVYLISAEGFPGIGGTLLIAVGESEKFRRFGFYSLDFSKR